MSYRKILAMSHPPLMVGFGVRVLYSVNTHQVVQVLSWVSLEDNERLGAMAVRAGDWVGRELTEAPEDDNSYGFGAGRYKVPLTALTHPHHQNFQKQLTPALGALSFPNRFFMRFLTVCLYCFLMPDKEQQVFQYSSSLLQSF